jgi:hypothetical protein
MQQVKRILSSSSPPYHSLSSPSIQYLLHQEERSHPLFRSFLTNSLSSSSVKSSISSSLVSPSSSLTTPNSSLLPPCPYPCTPVLLSAPLLPPSSNSNASNIAPPRPELLSVLFRVCRGRLEDELLSEVMDKRDAVMESREPRTPVSSTVCPE